MIVPVAPASGSERGLKLWVSAGIAVTVLILTSFVGLSYAVDRRLITLDDEPAIEIEVTAHQWWWELRYPGPRPSDTFATANEMHVPLGQTVKLKLKSVDVIHSFWLPNLAGKADIIPGRDQDLVFRADKEGTWHGRCSEYCGLQHAFMGLTLIVDEPAQFQQWLAAQRAEAIEPRTDEERRGRDVFATGPCGLCHVIRGTDAAGHSSSAPDLTHLKSRTTIGAGAAPNSKGHLGGWIIDPQGIKPGVHMPTILQEPNDFQALLAYLEILK
jgi:cytochrome c oxidase subunit 2